MLSKLFRAFQGSQHGQEEQEEEEAEPSPGPSRRPYVQPRHATADFTEAEEDDDDDSNGGIGGFRGDERTPDDEDGQLPSSHVLPLFSSSHLGRSRNRTVLLFPALVWF